MERSVSTAAAELDYTGPGVGDERSALGILEQLAGSAGSTTTPVGQRVACVGSVADLYSGRALAPIAAHYLSALGQQAVPVPYLRSDD